MRLVIIAANTVRQILRMRLTLVFILFLVLVLVAVPFALKSDGTQKGKVQITLTYSLGFLNIILSLLTLFLSTFTFSSDIRNKVILTIDTKPIRRCQVLIGKWLGIMVLDIALLICLGGAIYATAMFLARPSPGRDEEQSSLRSQVLTARTELKPRMEQKKASTTVPSQHEEEWVFENIRTAPTEEIVTIRFRGYAAGKTRQQLSGLWTAGSKEGGFYQYMATLPAGSFHEFRVPSAVISPEGRLKVRFLNISPGISIIFPANNLTVLYRVGGFGGNLLRGLFFLLLRLAFIAIVGLTSSTFLTFPVAILLSIFIVTLSLSAGFVETLMQGPALPGLGLAPDAGSITTIFIRRFATVGLRLLPNLRAYDPLPYIVSGVLIKWRFVMQGLVDLLLRSVIIGFLGCIIFNRREVANMGYL